MKPLVHIVICSLYEDSRHFFVDSVHAKRGDAMRRQLRIQKTEEYRSVVVVTRKIRGKTVETVMKEEK